MSHLWERTSQQENNTTGTKDGHFVALLEFEGYDRQRVCCQVLFCLSQYTYLLVFPVINTGLKSPTVTHLRYRLFCPFINNELAPLLSPHRWLSSPHTHNTTHANTHTLKCTPTHTPTMDTHAPMDTHTYTARRTHTHTRTNIESNISIAFANHWSIIQGPSPILKGPVLPGTYGKGLTAFRFLFPYHGGHEGKQVV